MENEMEGDLVQATFYSEEVETQKIELYTNLMGYILKFGDPAFQKSIKGDQKKLQKLGRDLAAFGAAAAIFGSPGVLREFIKWRDMAAGSSPEKNIVMKFADVMLEMRRDLGMDMAGIDSGDMYRSFVSEE